MKSYRNNELGFEINSPDEWPTPTVPSPNSIVFNCTPVERFNFIVGPLIPERLLEYTQGEFIQYAKSRGYTGVETGQIIVENRNYAWGRYNMGNENWAKKYMLVFGGIEYAITASCLGKKTLLEKEKQWDVVVKSFRLLEWRQQEVRNFNERRSIVAGKLFEKAYETAAEGRYQEACIILESCLKENPNHLLAHKELAFILKNTGDIKGALIHRQVVKRFDPMDQVNLYNLAMIYYMLGSKGDAIQEINDLLKKNPNDRRYIETKKYFET
jgi:tetratricopeptide (TPR) repeat protein